MIDHIVFPYYIKKLWPIFLFTMIITTIILPVPQAIEVPEELGRRLKSCVVDVKILDENSPENYVRVESYSNEIRIYINILSYELKCDEGKKYTYIDVPGLDYYYVPGNPIVPYKRFYVLVPANTVNVSISLQPIIVKRLEIEEPLEKALPLQPAYLEKNIGANMLQDVYENIVWPGNLCESFSEQWLGPYKLIPLSVYPIQYYEGNLTLKIVHVMRITLNIISGDVVESEARRPETSVVNKFLKTIALNTGATKIYYNENRYHNAVEESCGNSYPYIIITSGDLEEIFRELASWRTALGYRSRVITVDWINSYFSGATIQDRIRNFIKYAYENWNTEYVVLGGDYDVVPPAYFYMEDSSSDMEAGGGLNRNYKATDMYYALLDGDWDPDGDGKLLECPDTDGDGYPDGFIETLPDTLPEVLVGRVPTYLTGSTSIVVDKIVDYERNVEVDEWLHKVLLAGAISNYENEDDRGLLKTDDAYPLECIREDFLDPIGYNYFRLYEDEGLDPSEYPHEASLTYGNFEYQFSNGYYAVFEAGHGSPTGHYRKIWAEDDGDDVPESDEMDWVEFANIYISLSAGNKTPITYVSACLLGKFDDLDNEAYAEYLIQEGEGSIAVIASSRISYYVIGWQRGYGGNQGLMYLFGEKLFDNNVVSVGEAFYASRIAFAMQYMDVSDYADVKDFLEYIFFGDPLTPIWRNPREISVVHPATINASQTSFTVTVTYMDDGSPVVNANVTVFSADGEVFAVAHTSESGVAIVNISSSIEVDTLNITVSGVDIIPYCSTISVRGAPIVAGKGAVHVFDGYDFGGWRDLYYLHVYNNESHITLKFEWYEPRPNLLSYDSSGSIVYGREVDVKIDVDSDPKSGDALGRDVEVYVELFGSYSYGELYRFNNYLNSWIYVSDLESEYVDYGISINGSRILEYLKIILPLDEIGVRSSNTVGIFFDKVASASYDYPPTDYGWLTESPYTLSVDGDPSDWPPTSTLILYDEEDAIGDDQYQEFNSTAFYSLWGDKIYHGVELAGIIDPSRFSNSTCDVYFELIIHYDLDEDGLTDIVAYYEPEGVWVYNYVYDTWLYVDNESYENAWVDSDFMEFTVDPQILDIPYYDPSEIYVEIAWYCGVVVDNPYRQEESLVYSLREKLTTICDVLDNVFNALPERAMFVYANPYRMTRPVAAYDVIAGGIIYGLCSNTQRNIFDDMIVEGDGEHDPGSLNITVSNNILMAFGGPLPNWLVKYYEYNNASLIKFAEMEDKYAFINTTSGEIIAFLNKPVDFEHEDMFVIEVFSDNYNNTIIIFYGFEWRGTWASAIYLHYLIDENLLDTLSSSVVVFHWVDSNNNLMPEPDEIERAYP